MPRIIDQNTTLPGRSTLREVPSALLPADHVNTKRIPRREAAQLELKSLIYAISHDLRAPIRHIEGYIRGLREQALAPGETSEKYLEGIEKATGRLSSLIDGVLALTQTANADLHRARFEPDSMVSEIITALERDIDPQRVTWTIHPLPEVSGDRALFGIVIQNLLSNAVKYSSARLHSEIEIGSYISEFGETVFFVRDNGVGFDMAYSDKLFGLFQRMHTEKEFAGAGVGLAVARCIVTRHGGRIWANAQAGSGAEFCFTLSKF